MKIYKVKAIIETYFISEATDISSLKDKAFYFIQEELNENGLKSNKIKITEINNPTNEIKNIIPWGEEDNRTIEEILNGPPKIIEVNGNKYQLIKEKLSRDKS